MIFSIQLSATWNRSLFLRMHLTVTWYQFLVLPIHLAADWYQLLFLQAISSARQYSWFYFAWPHLFLTAPGCFCLAIYIHFKTGWPVLRREARALLKYLFAGLSCWGKSLNSFGTPLVIPLQSLVRNACWKNCKLYSGALHPAGRSLFQPEIQPVRKSSSTRP